MYVYYLERIVQGLAKDPSLTLTRDLRLAFESSDAFGVPRELRRQNLDRDIAPAPIAPVIS